MAEVERIVRETDRKIDTLLKERAGIAEALGELHRGLQAEARAQPR
jgi:chorismate mutase